MIRDKRLPDVSDIQNLSSKEGIRIVLELRKNADIEKIKNIIYKKTKLEDVYSVNMVAISDGRPVQMALKDIFDHHIRFCIEFNTKKYHKLLEDETKHREIVEGYIAAIDVIDLIIEIVRGSKTKKDAVNALMGSPDNVTFKTKANQKKAEKLTFTETQANAILDMRLQKLIGMEIMALQTEYKTVLANIKRYEKVLSNQKAMLKVIRNDIEAIYKTYPVSRQTQIINQEAAVEVKEDIPVMPVVFAMSRLGYIKCFDDGTYEKNKETIENENKYILQATTGERILFFTDAGFLYQLKVAQLPLMKAKEKGTHVESLISFRTQNEKILYVSTSSKIKEKQLLFITAKGLGKRTNGTEFLTNNRIVSATKLQEEDSLVYIAEYQNEPYVTLLSESGRGIRFKADEIAEGKKTSLGCKCMGLEGTDHISEAILSDANGKLSLNNQEVPVTSFRLTKRGGNGTKKREEKEHGNATI